MNQFFFLVHFICATEASAVEVANSLALNLDRPYPSDCVTVQQPAQMIDETQRYVFANQQITIGYFYLGRIDRLGYSAGKEPLTS